MWLRLASNLLCSLGWPHTYYLLPQPPEWTPAVDKYIHTVMHESLTNFSWYKTETMFIQQNLTIPPPYIYTHIHIYIIYGVPTYIIHIYSSLYHNDLIFNEDISVLRGKTIKKIKFPGPVSNLQNLSIDN